ncbi:MAG: hypothetical protein K9G67_02920 [Bacteroidales bacterium]|nr:hypothetical protein [Bacteroidales bacterium]MCF8344453.1 hypothetical protein [Bacteroidales bacterium]MCF8351599.1 hypothetical protein [Bacteroidales bacterium]MCF8375281.1 hypothetical protein [Bacteroidales bacterium]MCF8401245.1 hypothetical protein [Bacteroidales bacterium]
MKTSVEISYYPLKDEFVDPIKEFIDRLNTHADITVRTDGMSTKIFGEYEKVMLILKSEIKKSFEVPHSVFIIKIVNADLDVVV